MANRDLIKGIDNDCEAVRAAVRRAERDGVTWPSGPTTLIKGIGNNCEAVQATMWPGPTTLIGGIGNNCEAVRTAAARPRRNSPVRPKTPPVRRNDDNREAVRASALHAEWNSGMPSAVPRERHDDALEACSGASGTRRKEVGRRMRALAVALGWVSSVHAEQRDMIISGRPAKPAVSTDTAPTRILRR